MYSINKLNPIKQYKFVRNNIKIIKPNNAQQKNLLSPDNKIISDYSDLINDFSFKKNKKEINNDIIRNYSELINKDYIKQSNKK